VNVILHFKNDFENYMRANLAANGFRPVPTEINELYIGYCNILLRRIEPHKRKIQKSDVFECPKKFREGLQTLESAILKGDNLLPWQSKNILNTGYHDRLFYDHGIRHLHLGEKKEDDSNFMLRTGSLLYCIVDLKTVYFIQILEHGEENPGELVATAKNNWPDLFPHFNDGQRTFGRLSPAAEGDRLQSLLTHYEDMVKENADAFMRQVKRLTKTQPETLEFHLMITPEGIACAEEIHSKLRFKLGVI